MTKKKEYVENNNLDKSLFLDHESPWVFVSKEFYSLLSDKPCRDRINQWKLCTGVFCGYSLFNAKTMENELMLNDVIESDEDKKYFDDRYPPLFIVNRKKSKNDFNAYLAKMFLDNCLKEDKSILFLPKLGEIGVKYKKNVINENIGIVVSLLNLMYNSGIIDFLKEKKEIKILEIGAGYGDLAKMMKNIFSDAEYTIVDIPESILFSMVNLSIMSKKEFNFLPNYKFDEYSGISENEYIDLIISIYSLSEMSKKVINYYVNKIKELLGENGIFLEANHSEDALKPLGKSSGEVLGNTLKNVLERNFKYNLVIGQVMRRHCLKIWSNSEKNINKFSKVQRYI